MESDIDWLEDMRRWARVGADSMSHNPSDELSAVGYEAAHPALQARFWPGAPTSENSSSKEPQ